MMMTDTVGTVDLVMDLRIPHERWGSTFNHILNYSVHHPLPPALPSNTHCLQPIEENVSDHFLSHDMCVFITYLFLSHVLFFCFVFFKNYDHDHVQKNETWYMMIDVVGTVDLVMDLPTRTLGDYL